MKPRVQHTKPSMSDPEIYCAVAAAANGSSDNCFEYIGRVEETFRPH